jgi:outer membrane protein assembly factor BamB
VVRWRTAIASGYAGPAVAGGKVFVTDRVLAEGARNPRSPFDSQTIVPGVERLLCLEETSGKVLWKQEYDCPYQVSFASGPRTTPVVHQGKVYTLGTMGHLLCVDAGTGRILWSKELNREYQLGKGPGSGWWGCAASPLLDGDRLICLAGGPGSIVVAFHKDTGKVLWKALSAAEAGYCSPVIYEQGRQRQLIVWHPEAVNSLDPETGRVFWSHPWRIKAGLSVSMPRLTGDRLFLTAFYDGPLMLQLQPGQAPPRVVWQARIRSEMPRLTDGLHSIMPTPFLVDGSIYGVCSYGQLRCLKADTGERLWATLRATTDGKEARWGNAFLVRHEDRFFLFNEKGDLIIARLTPKGYEEIDRAHILEPDNHMPGRAVVWSHPAFAQRSMYARNDHEIVCVSLATNH